VSRALIAGITVCKELKSVFCEISLTLEGLRRRVLKSEKCWNAVTDYMINYVAIIKVLSHIEQNRRKKISETLISCKDEGIG